MNRRTFLKKTGITAASLSVAPMLFAKSSTKSKHNIILYVVDDQGSGDAGCYGNPVIKTPGLDYLAEHGTRFTNAFCTTASCSPSRSVILSGLHNHANGMFGLNHAVHHFQSFDNFKSLSGLLSEVGYRTMCAGKYHLGPEETYHFDEYLNFEWAQMENGKWLPIDTPVDLADKCMSFISDDSSNPFFLYFCTIAPHRPFLREGINPVNPDDVIVPLYLPDIPECREELAQYYMSVERADSGLVRLIEILKKTNHWDDTLIIFCSDNGIAFPGAKTTTYDPGINLPFVVRNPYSEKKGTVNNAMVSYVDIMPTILDFAGLSYESNYNDTVKLPDVIKFSDPTPQNKQLHGRSFLPMLDESDPEGWDEIYASHSFHEVYMYYPMRVVRERKFKLIWNIAYQLDYPFAADLLDSKTWQAVLENEMKIYGKRSVDAYLHRPEFELYDVEKDPHEINNLADNPEYKNELERLKKKLKAFQIRTEDRWLNQWIGK